MELAIIIDLFFICACLGGIIGFCLDTNRQIKSLKQELDNQADKINELIELLGKK